MFNFQISTRPVFFGSSLHAERNTRNSHLVRTVLVVQVLLHGCGGGSMRPQQTQAFAPSVSPQATQTLGLWLSDENGLRYLLTPDEPPHEPPTSEAYPLAYPDRVWCHGTPPPDDYYHASPVRTDEATVAYHGHWMWRPNTSWFWVPASLGGPGPSGSVLQESFAIRTEEGYRFYESRWVQEIDHSPTYLGAPRIRLGASEWTPEPSAQEGHAVPETIEGCGPCGCGPARP